MQSAHAVIEATKAFELECLSDHPSVIVLAAKNEHSLHRVRKYLVDQNVRHVHFYEPDMDNELTALSTEPIYGDRRGIFKKYQLLDTTPNAQHIRYARKHTDGSYYRWMGECGRSEHKTWNIEDANLFDSKEDALAWNHDSEAVPVKVCYHIKKGGAL